MLLITDIILEDTSVISIGDLKDIIKEQNIISERENKINKLQLKIDQIVDDGTWDFDDVFQDHNYCQTQDSTIIACVVYFPAG